jgi:hypothetical protein
VTATLDQCNGSLPAEPCPLSWCMKSLGCEEPRMIHIHHGRESLVRTGDASVEVGPTMEINSEGCSGPRVGVRVEDLTIHGTGQQHMGVCLTPEDALAFADALEAAAAGDAPEGKPLTFGTVDDVTVFEGDLIAVKLLPDRVRIGSRDCRLVEVSAEWGHETWSPVAQLLDGQAETLASYVRMCVAEVTR